MGKSFLGNNHDGLNKYALARAAERVELVHHEELRLFTFEHLAAACRQLKIQGRVAETYNRWLLRTRGLVQ